MQRILEGDGNKNHPYVIRDLGGTRWEGVSLKEALKLCRESGVNKLLVAHSGRYFELREDGWFETSDTEQCDRVHNLPSEGRLIKV